MTQGIRIAVTGKMRSGKDTFARYLIESQQFHEAKFSEGISDVINLIFPREIHVRKSRKHYQHIGQSMRQLDPDIWIKYTMWKLSQEQLSGNIIVTDLRQPNEAEYLKSQDFCIVKIETPEEMRIERMKVAGDKFSLEDLNHETETLVDDIKPDFIIKNEGTIPSLELEAIKLLEKLKNFNH